jgi:hypothetical protein
MTDRAVQPEAPTTEAGRRYLAPFIGGRFEDEVRAAIVAIEVEARAAPQPLSQERPQSLDEGLPPMTEADKDRADDLLHEQGPFGVAQERLPIDVFSTDDLVAELRRRNLNLSSADDLLRGLSEPEILDFVDAGAVTAEQARDYMRGLSRPTDGAER